MFKPWQFLQQTWRSWRLQWKAGKRFQLAIDGSNDGIWDWNLRTNQVYFSPRWKSMLGYEDSEIGTGFDEWTERLHPEDRERAEQSVRDALEGDDDSYQAEFRMRHKDGTYRWILARGRFLRDAQGRAFRAAGSHTDITDRKQTEQALHESKARYQTLFEATFEAILVHRDGVILEVNKAFEILFGYPRAEAIGLPVIQTVAPESRSLVQQKIEREEQGIYEGFALRKDGSTFPVKAHARLITYQGLPTRVSAIRDLTEHRRVERALLERRQLAESLNETAAAIASNLTIDAVLDSILHNVGRVVPHDAANIMLHEGDSVRIVRARGYQQWGGDASIIGTAFKIEEVPDLRETFRSATPVIMDDTHLDPGWIPTEKSNWIRSFVGVPIQLGDAVMGTLNLDSARPGAFSHEQVESLLTFASQAAIALQNARLYEAEQRASNQAQALLEINRTLSSTLSLDEVLQRILKEVVRVVPYATGSILTYHEGQAEMVAISGYSSDIAPKIVERTKVDLSDSPILVDLVDGQDTVIIDDVRQHPGWRTLPGGETIRSWMGIPLVSRGQVIGVLMLDSPETGFYRPDHARAARAFADQVAIAIENARLYKAQVEARLQAQTLLEINQTLSSTLSLEEVLATILEQCGKVLPFVSGAILNYEEGVFQIVTLTGYGDRGLRVMEEVNHNLPDNSIYQRLIERRAPIISADVREEDEWIVIDDASHIRAWMCIPLIHRGKLLGALTLDSDQVGTYTPQHSRLAQAFADQAAIAIHNAQVYEAERHERTVAETLRETSEALATALNLDQTLELILRLLKRIVHFDGARVVLYQGGELRVLAAEGLISPGEQIVGRIRSLSDYPQFMRILEMHAPYLVDDTRKEPGWMGDHPPRSWIGTPLAARGQMIGFLTVGSVTPGVYTQKDVEMVSTFSSQAAIAIENARLLMELSESLSDLQVAHENLARSSRLSAAGEIAMGIAHQVNNPLTTVIAETHLLLNRMTPGSMEHELVMSIKQAAYKAGTVVQRLLDFSRVRPYQLDVMDANQSLRSAISLIHAQIEPHHTLELDLDQSLPLIVGSEEHLQDVWINLILNARDALGSRNNGKINVMTRRVDSEDAIEIQVIDNGKGISKENLARIFDPFYTTKDYGTGLGLSVCHDVIEYHGGTIVADSVEDAGTIFTIRLPVADVSANLELLHEEEDE